VIFDEASGVPGIGEIQSMPVDDRAAGEYDPKRLDVVQRELVEPFQTGSECRAQSRVSDQSSALSGSCSWRQKPLGVAGKRYRRRSPS
jgi:hypothetical protein